MHTRRTVLRALLGATLLSLLVACSDDPDPTAQDYVDAATAAMLEDGSGFTADEEEEARCLAEGFVHTASLEMLVREDVSPREFAELEALSDLPFLLPEDAPQRLTSTLDECVDLDAQLADMVNTVMPVDDPSCMLAAADSRTMARSMAESLLHGEEDAAWVVALFVNTPPDCMERLLLEGLVNDGTLTPDQAACVGPSLDDVLAHRVFTTAATGGTPSSADQAAFEGVLRTCLTG